MAYHHSCLKYITGHLDCQVLFFRVSKIPQVVRVGVPPARGLSSLLTPTCFLATAKNFNEIKGLALYFWIRLRAIMLASTKEIVMELTNANYSRYWSLRRGRCGRLVIAEAMDLPRARRDCAQKRRVIAQCSH